MNRSSFIVGTATALGLAGIRGPMARADTDPPKSWQDVRALIARFMDAQNAHNLDVTSALLWNSPTFEMRTADTVVRGHDQAVDRFNALYQGMWRISPDYSSLNIQIVDAGHAQFTVPIEYKTGEANGDPITTQSIVQAQAVLTTDGWRIASITPSPPPVTTR